MTTDMSLIPDDTEQTIEDKQAETNASVAGATGILALGNILSRVLGLVREKALAYFFGAGVATDAYLAAIIIPKTFYDLLIGGHVNGAIVPVLSDINTTQGRKEMWNVVNILVTVMLMFVSAIVLIMMLFAPFFVSLVGGGYGAYTQELATTLLRITSPALIFLSLFAIFSGTLYAINNFTLPALAGAVFNACIVLSIMFLSPALQAMPGNDPIGGIIVARPAAGVTAAAIGWFIGAAVQMALQLPGLKLTRIRLRFDWRHPALRSIALLYAPVMFSLLLDALVIRFFSYNLASRTGIVGGFAYINYATTLIQFPQGLVATAISIAILPTLATQAALGKDENITSFRDTLGLGLRLATTLIIPATIGLFVLANPIVQLLFEGGEFKAIDTIITSQALRFYLFGLPFAAIDLLLVYAFYARKDTLTPALVGVFSHIVYIITVLLLFDTFSLYSLMIADSVKHIAHALISGILLSRRMDGFGKQNLISNALKTLFAAGVMGVVAWWLLPILTAWIGVSGAFQLAIVVLLVTSTAGSIFFVLAAFLRIEELYWIVRLVRKRLGS